MPIQTKIPTVRFNLKVHSSDSEETLIVAVFRYNGNRLVYSTKEKVLPRYWNGVRMRCNNVVNHPEYADINDRLNEIDKTIRDIYKNNDFEIEIADFKKQLDLALGRTRKVTLTEDAHITFSGFIDEYLRERKHAPTYKWGTWKILQTCKNHIVEFGKAKGINPIEFNNIDWQFRKDLEHWLFKEKGLSINYVAKMMDVFRQFLHEAVRRRLTNIDIHMDKGWSIKKMPTKKFRYTFAELETLYNLDLSSNETLEKTRDLFLIGAYSGLRFSDFNRLKPEHFVTDEEHELIVLHMDKTKGEVVVPVLPILKELMEKYSYDPPKFVNQVFNRNIKEVCRLSGMDEKITKLDTSGGQANEVIFPKWELTTSHVARRSFASNFYELGIPAIHLMQITGHKTERQFMNYICISGRDSAIHILSILNSDQEEQ